MLILIYNDLIKIKNMFLFLLASPPSNGPINVPPIYVPIRI